MAHVTIIDTPSFVVYDVTTSDDGPFTVPFAVFDEADIAVEVDGVSIGTAFSFTPTSTTTGGYQTGTVTLDAAVANAQVVIFRNITPARTSDYGVGPLPKEAVNNEFDKMQAQIADLRRDNNRALRAPIGETVPSLEKASVRAGKLQGYDTQGNPVSVDPATLDAFTVASGWQAALLAPLASGWATLLGLATNTSLAIAHTFAKAFRLTLPVDTKAALKGLTSPSADIVYRLKARSTSGDLGGGDFRWDSSNLATQCGVDTQEGIYIPLSGNNGSGGAFVRILETAESQIEWWGGRGDLGTTDNTPPYNCWFACAFAGYCPLVLRLNDGYYFFDSLPNELEDLPGVSVRGMGTSNTVIRADFDQADETTGLIHLLGSSNGGVIEDFTIGTHGNRKGGCGVKIEAKASSASDAVIVRNIRGTYYSGTSALVISAATVATEAVFTSTAHGYSTNDEVVFLYGNAQWETNLSHNLFKVTVVDANTFKLRNYDTNAFVNSTGWTAYSANSATVKKALSFDWPLWVDGTDRTASPVGQRDIRVENCFMFGGRRGAGYFSGMIDPDVGCGSSDAGLDGTIKITGDATVATYYAVLSAPSIARLEIDYAYYTKVPNTVQGNVSQTANTVHSIISGFVGGDITRAGTKTADTDYIHLSGGMALQVKSITGVTGSYATFSWPVAFKSTPVIYDGVGINSGSFAIVICNSASTTGVQVAGSNLNVNGDVIIWAIGEREDG